MAPSDDHRCSARNVPGDRCPCQARSPQPPLPLLGCPVWSWQRLGLYTASVQAPSSVGGATELEVLSTVTQVVPDSVLMASSGTKEIPRKAATVSAGVLCACQRPGSWALLLECCTPACSLSIRCLCRWHPVESGRPARVQGVCAAFQKLCLGSVAMCKALPWRRLKRWSPLQLYRLDTFPADGNRAGEGI
jgi:hypothetical protein